MPPGVYLATVLTPTKHSRVERLIYRGIGVNPEGQQSPRSYLVAVLAFSGVSIVVLMAILNTASSWRSQRTPIDIGSGWVRRATEVGVSGGRGGGDQLRPAVAT